MATKGNAIVKTAKGAKAEATRKAGITAVSADMLKRIGDAWGTSSETELQRLAIVQELRQAGYSVRAAVAAVVKANRGNPVRGFSTSGAGRYWTVSQAFDNVAFPTLTPAQDTELRLAAVTLANYGVKAADLRNAVGMAAKAANGRDVVSSIRAAVKAAGTAAISAATDAPAKRPGAITPGGRKTETETETPDADTTPTPKRDADAHALDSVGLSRLFAEIVRRVSVKGFVAAESDARALAVISEAYDAAVLEGRTVNA